MAQPIIIAAIILVAIIVSALVYISTRPDSFQIRRSAEIPSSPDVLFGIINDLHRWSEWSPYEKFDPQMKKSFEGAAFGPGASYAWNGNKHVGEGRLTIVESQPGEHVTMKLEFSRPFKCNNQVVFKLYPIDNGTNVSWIMDGKNTFISKAFGLLMNMDKMVGQQFEEGLANLKKLVQPKT